MSNIEVFIFYTRRFPQNLECPTTKMKDDEIPKNVAWVCLFTPCLLQYSNSAHLPTFIISIPKLIEQRKKYDSFHVNRGNTESCNPRI